MSPKLVNMVFDNPGILVCVDAEEKLVKHSADKVIKGVGVPPVLVISHHEAFSLYLYPSLIHCLLVSVNFYCDLCHIKHACMNPDY